MAELPHDINAEKSVLSEMLLTTYALQKGVETLSVDSFYDKHNGMIFEAIASLANQGSPVDFITVTSELDKRKHLVEIGGVEVLSEILNKEGTAVNIDEHIKIVEDKAILRSLINTADQISRESTSSSLSITEILDTAEKRMLNVIKNRRGSEFKNINDVVAKAKADIEKLSEKNSDITGIPTGFRDIDKLTSGLHPNELIIIAARPAMGKTAFALNLATNMAINSKKSVALFNMEMAAEQLAFRMLASLGQISQGAIKTGNLNQNDWKKLGLAISNLSDTNLYIDDNAGSTISEIRAKCRRLAASSVGLDAVIIDYLGLISGGDSRYAGNRQMEVSEISRSLKTLAMELGIPVIACAQLSRNVEGKDRKDKKPMLSDLRESGSIEQDADIVAFLYREDYYNKEKVRVDTPYISDSLFIIAKHRNGPTAEIPLFFNRSTSTFKDGDNVVQE